jgi:hypothetical protein
MEPIDLIEDPAKFGLNMPEPESTIASGLFGGAASDDLETLKSAGGYLRGIEQMPNFSPDWVERFVMRYVQSNIGETKSNS